MFQSINQVSRKLFEALAIELNILPVESVLWRHFLLNVSMKSMELSSSQVNILKEK